MDIHVDLLRLYNDKIKTNRCYDLTDMLMTLSDAKLYDVTDGEIYETDIMKKLLYACDENNTDVILIIGDIESLDRCFVIEAIENVSNRELSKNLKTLMSSIETKLENTKLHKTVCGIRNQSLIIDLSGENVNPNKCLKAVADIILQVIHIIRTGEEIMLHDVLSSSSNNSADEEDEIYSEESTIECTSPNEKEATSSLVLSPEENMPARTPPNKKKASSPLALSPNTIKRHKESFPMISIADALLKMQEVINDSPEGLGFEKVQLHDAFGRILYRSVEATYNLPPFKASTKDGYAVLAFDGNGLRKVLSKEDISSLTSFESGTCVQVKKGDPIPHEATAVVQMKDTKPVEKFESCDDTYIEIMIEPENEENIKPIGYDLMKGNKIGTACKRVGPMEMALLAASGHKEITVFKHISVGVMSIGSNLEKLGESLKPGFVYDLNRITLISLLKEKGYHSLDLGIVDDKLESIHDQIGEALKKVDLLVTTGSNNNRNSLKIILEKYYKADIHFENVNMKPGKSTIFATCKIDDTIKYFLCLSGNPVSAHISAHVFLLPLVNELHYNFYTEQTVIPACVKHQYTLHDRCRVAWTILEWNQAQLCAVAFNKDNFINEKLTSASGANALIFLPERKKADVISKTHVTALLVKLPKKYNKKQFCTSNVNSQFKISKSDKSILQNFKFQKSPTQYSHIRNLQTTISLAQILKTRILKAQISKARILKPRI